MGLTLTGANFNIVLFLSYLDCTTLQEEVARALNKMWPDPARRPQVEIPLRGMRIVRSRL